MATQQIRPEQLVSPWTPYLVLPLDSLTNWSSSSGTWGLTSGQIKQTAVTVGRYHLATWLPTTVACIQVDVNIDAAIGSGARQAGLRIGDGNGATTGFPYVRLEMDSGGSITGATLLNDGIVGIRTLTQAGAAGYHTLSLVMGGGATAYLDGTVIASMLPTALGNMSKISLYAENAGASFRNLRVLTAALPA